VNQQTLSAFIWSIADLLRGDFKQSEYGRVILPFTVLRRLDCQLAKTKTAVLREHEKHSAAGVNPIPFVERIAGRGVWNLSPLDLKKINGDPDQIRENIYAYLQGFSPAISDIFERFEFHAQIDRLSKAKLLFQVSERFSQIDLHPETVDNHQMGLVFEELIRRFAEVSNETAGEHFTPREVIRLMVSLIFTEDSDVLSMPGVVRALYDPTAGTGGMLSVAGEYLAELNPQARLTVFGQELNPESYAICKADMLIKGQDVSNIAFGNTLTEDGFPGQHFDYMLSNPPFGVEWRKVEREVREEHEKKGFAGRFGPGLPRVSDGSLLFLLHLVSKMRPAAQGGARFAIVLNGSALFTGGPGSGESEIRRSLIESDLLEAVIALPTEMFYNTAIPTYIWVVTNRKPARRKGAIQLIDASGLSRDMRRSLGLKRKEMSDSHIEQVAAAFGRFAIEDFVATPDDGRHSSTQIFAGAKAVNSSPAEEGAATTPFSRIVRNEEFGYRAITIDRPLRDAQGNVVLHERGKSKGRPQADASLRDTENVALTDDVEEFFRREVLPHCPDAWVDSEKTRVGYEISFSRHFCSFRPSASLSKIDAELLAVSERLKATMNDLHSGVERALKGGLDPDLPMKESGVPWLGRVPAHWRVCRLATLFSDVDERGRDGLPVLSVSIHTGVSDDELDDADAERKFVRSDDKSKYKRVLPGDLVYNMMRAWQGGFGHVTVEGMVSPAHVVARPKSAYPTAFIEALLRTPRAIEEIRSRSRGVTDFRLRLYWEEFKNIVVALPPIEEAQEILSQMQRAASARSIAEEFMSLLSGRRAALVSEAAAGNLDTRALLAVKARQDG
jgi:type I restriction enzyme M protein